MSFDPTAYPWWHIVWVTYLSWPPKDARGDWRNLAEFYSGFAADGLEVEMSEPLPNRWQCKPYRAGTVELSLDARQLLRDDLYQLSESDRVAGDTFIQADSIRSTAVQLLLSCPAESLSQRIGRMKSRSATLLSFRPALGIAGKSTWGSGIWWAKIGSEEARQRVNTFLLRDDRQSNS